MIRDQKGGLITRALEWYVARKVRSAFRGVWVRGTFPTAEGGLLAYANHSSFWDGFLIHQLAKAAGWDGYAMMEEDNLAKYRFHARIGAFSVKRDDPRTALASIRYTRDVLSRRNAAVFVFPEGEIHAGQGPLGPLQRGVEVIARTANVRSLPVAIRYCFLEHEHPDVLVELGTPHAPGELAVFEEALRTTYERVMSARSTEGFTRIIKGRSSVQERWDTVRRLPPPPDRAPRLSPGAVDR